MKTRYFVLILLGFTATKAFAPNGDLPELKKDAGLVVELKDKEPVVELKADDNPHKELIRQFEDIEAEKKVLAETAQYLDKVSKVEGMSEFIKAHDAEIQEEMQKKIKDICPTQLKAVAEKVLPSLLSAVVQQSNLPGNKAKSKEDLAREIVRNSRNNAKNPVLAGKIFDLIKEMID